MKHILVAVAPVVILLLYFYYRDKREKEPLKLLAKAFLGGVLSAAAVITLHYFLQPWYPEFNHILADSLFTAFVQAAFSEELFKFIFLILFIWRVKQFDEYYDGILYAVFVALGFACIENIMYVYSQGIEVGIGRAFLAVPGHALDGVIMGYYFSLAKFVPEKRMSYLAKSLFVAVLTHGIWDFLAIYTSNAFEKYPLIGGITLIAFFIFVGRLYRICRRKINELLAEDV